MFASFSDRLNFGAGGGTVSNQPSAFPTRQLGDLGNFNTFAINFIIASGITASNQQSAINQLSTDLVNTGLINKLVCIYPFVGGNATSHSINLKDPRNDNTAFRLSFSGGITHSSTGVLFNGVNGFANTFFITPPSMSNNMSFIAYHTTNTSGQEGGNSNTIDMGAAASAVSGIPGNWWNVRRANNTANVFFSSAAVAGGISATVTDCRGFWVVTITNPSLRRIYRNGSIVATSTTTLSHEAYPFANYIGGLNVGNALALPAYRDYAFAAIGFGITETEQLTLYTIVQNFQTTLGRQA